jgi:N-methylhydantoinase B
MSTSVVSGIDPVTFEILSHRLHQITKEMAITLERAGGTVNTTQMRDYMTALYLPNGDILSAGESMGWHVACAGFAVRHIIAKFENGSGIDPDDIFLLNDPYVAAIHQSDVYIISPIHYRDNLIGWSGSFVHVADIGAMSPGGNSPGATEVYHEGLRIPGIKLIERGKLRRDVFESILNMTRQPEMVGLDLKCEIAANNVAKARMQELYGQYGAELVSRVSAEMITYSESVLRNRLAEIPDGAWSDGCKIRDVEERKIALTLRKNGNALTFDFSGTDGQSRRGVNIPYHGTFGACFEALLTHLAYDLPKNHGLFRCMEVKAPRGTVVNPELPAPVSMSTTSSGAIVKGGLARSVIVQMLATTRRWKSEAMGATVGFRAIRHAGMNRSRNYYVSSIIELDGHGARSEMDGVDSGGEGSNMTAPNIEWIEQSFPVLYLFRRHAKDSSGPGRFRGGAGGEAVLIAHDAPLGIIRCVASGVIGLTNSGRGVFGGYPGAPSVVRLARRTKIREFLAGDRLPQSFEELGGEVSLLPYTEFELQQDGAMYLRRASGGGYGNPLERDPHRVLADLADGLISRESARDVYGVVANASGALDPRATRELRASLERERRGQETATD